MYNKIKLQFEDKILCQFSFFLCLAFVIRNLIKTVRVDSLALI